MSDVLIRRAFETRLGTYAAAQSMPVAWENVALNPQPTGPYLRGFLLPAGTSSLSLDRLHRQRVGIYQIDVCMPTGTGPSAAEAIVAALEYVFLPSVVLNESGLLVYIVDPLSRGPALQDADRYVIPCSILYRADT